MSGDESYDELTDKGYLGGHYTPSGGKMLPKPPMSYSQSVNDGFHCR